MSEWNKCACIWFIFKDLNTAVLVHKYQKQQYILKSDYGNQALSQTLGPPSEPQAYMAIGVCGDLTFFH